MVTVMINLILVQSRELILSSLGTSYGVAKVFFWKKMMWRRPMPSERWQKICLRLHSCTPVSMNWKPTLGEASRISASAFLLPAGVETQHGPYEYVSQFRKCCGPWWCHNKAVMSCSTTSSLLPGYSPLDLTLCSYKWDLQLQDGQNDHMVTFKGKRRYYTKYWITRPTKTNQRK